MKKDHGIPIVYSDHSSRDIPESFNARQTDKEGAFLMEKSFNLHVKRSDDESFIEATAKGDYTYCLNQEELTDIARVVYNNYQTTKTKMTQFEVIDYSIAQLKETITKFLIKARLQSKNKDQDKKIKATLTLMIYQAESKHWSTLIVDFDRGVEQGFHADSKKQSVSDELQTFFDKNKIELTKITKHFVQQQDDYNSGLWALENAADINRMLNYDQELVWGINQLAQSRNEEYFKLKRIELVEKLSFDSQWRARYPNAPINLEEQKKYSLGFCTKIRVQIVMSLLRNDLKRIKRM